jgi:hypothetical protein
VDDWNKSKRERWRSLNRYIKEFHKKKDRAHKEKLDKIQREKITLLKNNDVEGYLRMVKVNSLIQCCSLSMLCLSCMLISHLSLFLC